MILLLLLLLIMMMIIIIILTCAYNIRLLCWSSDPQCDSCAHASVSAGAQLVNQPLTFPTFSVYSISGWQFARRRVCSGGAHAEVHVASYGCYFSSAAKQGVLLCRVMLCYGIVRKVMSCGARLRYGAVRYDMVWYGV